jgi:hypothetical protein
VRRRAEERIGEYEPEESRAKGSSKKERMTKGRTKEEMKEK